MEIMTNDEFKKQMKKLIARRGSALEQEDTYDAPFALRYGMLDACDETRAAVSEISEGIINSLKIK